MNAIKPSRPAKPPATREPDWQSRRVYNESCTQTGRGYNGIEVNTPTYRQTVQGFSGNTLIRETITPKTGVINTPTTRDTRSGPLARNSDEELVAREMLAKKLGYTSKRVCLPNIKVTKKNSNGWSYGTTYTIIN